MSDEFCGGIAKHSLSGRVNCLDDAAAGMEGDDAVHHGIEYRLDQRGTVAQGLLRCIFLGDIAEHQHGTDHLTVAVANRCATVGDSALAAIACNQYGVVGQALYRAMRQGFHYRDSGGLTGFLVDDVKNLVHRATDGFRLRPTGELFGKGIQERHARFGIGGYHCIADGVERNGELFLADLQGDVGLLQLFIRLLLNLEQMLSLCFDLLARGVVGADQQVADNCTLSIAQRRDRHDRREAAAILADVGQLVDVLDAA